MKQFLVYCLLINITNIVLGNNLLGGFEWETLEKEIILEEAGVGKFIFKGANKSTSPVEFVGAETECPCMKVVPIKTIVEPLGKGGVFVQLSSNGSGGKETHLVIVKMKVGGEVLSTELTCNLVTPQLFTIEPKEISWEQGNSSSKAIQIFLPKGCQVTFNSANFISSHSNSLRVGTTLRELPDGTLVSVILQPEGKGYVKNQSVLKGFIGLVFAVNGKEVREIVKLDFGG